VISFSPFPGTTTAPTQLTVTFDNTDIDATKIVPANFSLTNQTSPVTTVDISGTMTISPANLVNNGNGTSTLTIPLTAPANGVLTFTMRATAATGMADVTGNSLNGEFLDRDADGMLELSDLPSGDAAAGGNFVAVFTFDNTPPTITDFRLADVSDVQTCVVASNGCSQTGPAGSNVDDDRTDDTTPTFSGTVTDAFPGSQTLQNIRIDIDVDGDGFDDGSAFANAAGVFSVTSITAIAPDTTARTISARAIDTGGNPAVGNTSATVQTVIGVDTLVPDSTFEMRTDAGATLPYNRTNDSTPSFGGVLTDQAPFNAAIAGNVGNLLVELDVDNDGLFDDGSTATSSTGAWQLQSTTTLTNGTYSPRIRFSDKVGHQVIKSLPGGSFVLETTSPRVTAVSPIGIQGTRPTAIVITFDESMFEIAAGPLFGSSVLNPANFMLIRSNGDGVIGNANDVTVTPVSFGYSDVGGSRVTITLPVGLPDDVYQLTLKDTVTDKALNPLDGEFIDRNTNGVFELTDLPSGNAAAGGNFVSTYVVDTSSPTITAALNLPQAAGGVNCPEFFPAFAALAGDTGVLCDARTNLRRPFISGRVADAFPGSAAGLQIRLDTNNDTIFNEGSAVTLADGSYAVQPTADLTEGSRTINVRVTDAAGNSAIVTTVIFIDVTPPAPPSRPDLDELSDTGISQSDDNTNDDTPTFRGTAEPNGTVTLFATNAALGLNNTPVGTAPVDSFGNWVITTASLVNLSQVATISFFARSTDAAGNTNNTASASLSVTIDRLAPTSSVPNLLAADDSGSSSTDDITRINRPRFDGTAMIMPDAIQVTLLNGSSPIGTATPAATTGAWTIQSLITFADGQYNIFAAATDRAGNIGTSVTSLLLTVDTTAPTPTMLDMIDTDDTCDPLASVSPAPCTHGSHTDNVTRVTAPTIRGIAEAGSTFTIFNNLTTQVPPTTTMTGNDASDGVPNNGLGLFSYMPSPALTPGTYNLTAQAMDLAGNVSNQSATFSVTIDNSIVAPALTGISPDNGPSSTDRKTNTGRITFIGSAEPGSFVTLTEGATVLSDSIVANTSGVWMFDNTANVLSDGDHTFNVSSVDVAGNTSTAAAGVVVSIDTAPPPVPGAPTLAAADDRGILGDDRTNLRRPRLTGVTEPGAFVEILNSFNAVLGTATADVFGTYLVAFAGDLVDGTHAVRVRASDQFGNGVPFNVSPEYNLTIDTTRPVVQSVMPAGTVTTNTLQIMVMFNNDDLNNTTAGNPAFAGSVQNPANYTLIGDGLDNIFGTLDDVAIGLTTSTFVYDAVTDKLTVTLLDAAGAPIQLNNDNYRFTINGTTSVQDIAGNSIQGGNFVHSLVVMIPPPRVISVFPVLMRERIQNATSHRPSSNRSPS
jgi:hypothetical protein